MTAKHALVNVCDVVKRSDIYHIDPEHISIDPAWNPRKSFDDITELIESIRERGVIRPLIVRKVDNNLYVVDGERRLRSVMELRNQGIHIASVPVTLADKKANEADLFFDSIAANDGKPLTAIEEAEAFKRLQNWGFSTDAIAKRTGKSVSHVRNRIELSGVSPEVAAAVESGEVAVTKAQKIAKEKDINKQKETLKKIKDESGRRRHTFFIKDGMPESKSECNPIFDLLDDNKFVKAVEDAGFEFESIRITIYKKEK